MHWKTLVFKYTCIIKQLVRIDLFNYLIDVLLQTACLLLRKVDRSPTYRHPTVMTFVDYIF